MVEMLQIIGLLIGAIVLYAFWGKLFALIDQSGKREQPWWFWLILLLLLYGSFEALQYILGIESSYD